MAIASQRPGVPQAVKEGFNTLLLHAEKASARPNQLVQQGIKLHDKGDYDGALQKYEAALRLWPQHSFAHYEVGTACCGRNGPRRARNRRQPVP